MQDKIYNQCIYYDKVLSNKIWQWHSNKSKTINKVILYVTVLSFSSYFFIGIEKSVYFSVKTFKLSLHEKPYFLFPDVLKRWSFQKTCAGIWSFLHYWERWYIFFSKIGSYALDGKWKMILLKKYTEIYFLQTFWKDGLSKYGHASTSSFLYHLKR